MQSKFFPASTNNYERGRGTEKIELIILHWSNAESLTQTDTKFNVPTRLASAHLAIENTTIHQYVKDENTAFHSGSSSVDKRSIGIICIGGVNMPISEATYQTLFLVIEELCRKYRIPIDRDHIKGHNEITKTFCPGELDIIRVVKEAKALSPQTILDKLKTQIEELKENLIQERKKSDTADARIEEVRLMLRGNQEELESKIKAFFYLESKYTDLERELKKAKYFLLIEQSRSLFSIIRDRIKRRFS